MNFNTNIVILVTAQVSSFYYQILNIVMQNTTIVMSLIYISVKWIMD